MYDVAASLVIWWWVGIIISRVTIWLSKKAWVSWAAKLAWKAIPYVGWSLLALWLATSWVENINYYNYCNNDLDFSHEWKWPLYYCGKLITNASFVAIWGAVSKVNIVWAFSARTKILWNFSWSQKDLVNERLSPEYMSPEVLKKNLENPDDFIKSFDDGKYPNLDTPWPISNWYDIWFNNWYFIEADWTILKGSLDFIVYKWDIKFWVWHSSLSWWKNIDFAGTVQFDNNGLPYSWSNNSWHYKPLETDKTQFIEAAKNKFNWFDFENVYFNNVTH